MTCPMAGSGEAAPPPASSTTWLPPEAPWPPTDVSCAASSFAHHSGWPRAPAEEEGRAESACTFIPAILVPRLPERTRLPPPSLLLLLLKFTETGRKTFCFPILDFAEQTQGSW